MNLDLLDPAPIINTIIFYTIWHPLRLPWSVPMAHERQNVCNIILKIYRDTYLYPRNIVYKSDKDV